MKPDEFAKNIQAEFELFQMSISNAYLTRVGAGMQISPLALTQLKMALNRALKQFELRIRTMTDEFLKSLEKGDLKSQKIRQDVFLIQVGSSMIENRQQVITKAIGAGRLANVFTRSLGAAGLILQSNVGRIQFVSHDASGRSWSTLTLIYQYARNFAYQSLIDSQAEVIDGLAVVKYPDPSHKDNGMIVDTKNREGENATNYKYVRKIIFHPNSNAELTPYVRT